MRSVLDTPCKINLFLNVEGRRPDGYHDINTIFLPLSGPRDTVTLEVLDDETLEVACDHPAAPSGPGNLCHRAAELFAAAANVTPRWRVAIEKRIPVAAGLGGGSSDAAATLRLLSASYPVLNEAELAGLALRLGADVPFFLAPRPARGRGLGERLSPLALAEGLGVLLLAPLFPISAKWAYEHCQPGPSVAAEPAAAAMRTGDWQALGKALHNDLATAAYRKFPALGLFRDRLLELGALGAAMSGSGPTMFALFEGKAAAEAVAGRLRHDYGDAVGVFSSEPYIS